MPTEVTQYADFSRVRYAQCWEDADVLLAALAIQPEHNCLAIASAGDNTLAMVAQGPKSVVAIDVNPAQIACLELRVAAYRCLTHTGLLELLGSRPTTVSQRRDWYRQCAPKLSLQTQQFWEHYPQALRWGFGSIGKFERYLRYFRQWLLPWIHDRATVAQLFQSKSLVERRQFYAQTWDCWRWRWLFHVFFSQFILGRGGRDPSFFRYAENVPVSQYLFARCYQALVELDPVQNPYLQWIALGKHQTAFPYALQAENFDRIRDHLNCLSWHCLSIEDFLTQASEQTFDRYNLSNIFEYMSASAYQAVLQLIRDRARPQARWLYWNLFVPRTCPAALAAQLQSRPDLATELYKRDRAFFYRDLVIEEVRGDLQELSMNREQF